ncbi:His-Xaa-Ser system radical SAM maturase HxsB [Flavisphingopyxis soli]|uniref:His-Xaa-Ser system radical SAM maturase HxsB n=1 Tax=Flavisphingopyxis soli TaxID=2601267 RepID=UPI001F268C96|nr:His-Xaa-Ser system radical SAM maturase HxsB [Sphingorhabdus soli]
MAIGRSISVATSDLSCDAIQSAHPAGIRFREVGDHTLVTNEAGRFAMLESSGSQSQSDPSFKLPDAIKTALIPENRLSKLAQTFEAAKRRTRAGPLDYLILVPTLRCNLACSYCQVSRAAIGASGHDWDDGTLAAVLSLVSSLSSASIKIEFQGGEPSLRPDLIEAVINAVPPATTASFVICTNLQIINDGILAIFDRPDVLISTSLDGPEELHSKQRQGDAVRAREFHKNLNWLIDRYGPGKISALPTINPQALPDPDALIDAYSSLGLHSLYLRPINFQGFARKRHASARQTDGSWSAYHERFIDRLIERNFLDRTKVLEETYFSLILRRIFQPGADRHVDLRNPNPVGRDYIVIDYDGMAYPTDEARMLTRSGVIDLSIGNVAEGWDSDARAALEAASTNDGDPTCEKCAYKPYCGRDIIDDISRYGTIDTPKEETEFCRRHLSLFDLAFKMIHSKDPAVRYSLGRWLGLGSDLPAMESAA